METESCEWYEYKCKSGETLFFYNAVTGEHRWTSCIEDKESNTFETEACDPPLHQQNEQGKFVRSLGTQTEDATALDYVAGMNTRSIGSQRDVAKTYSSTGMETVINGVSDSRVLQALFNRALTFCSEENVCRDVSVEGRSVSQTKGGDGDPCDICDVHQLEMEHDQLEETRNEEMNISSLQENTSQEPHAISQKSSVDKEDYGKMLYKEFVDGQHRYLHMEIADEVPQIFGGINYDEPVSYHIKEPEVNNELLDGHHDSDDVEIIPCVSGTTSGGAEGKGKCRNYLIDRNQQDIVVPYFLEDDLKTHSSERFDSDRQSESSGLTPILNSMQAESSTVISAECESIPECLDNNVTVRQVNACLGLRQNDESVVELNVVKGFPRKLHDNRAEEVSFECEKLNNDGNRQDMLSSVTDPGNALGQVEDETLSTSGEPCCIDAIPNQVQSISKGETIYKCTQCEKTFTWRGNLVVHLRTHAGEMIHKCTECVKVFKSRSYLYLHFRSHAQDRPFKCTQCDKAFKTRSHLSVHLLVHTKERPFKCTQCDKAFKTRSDLFVHRGVHTQERPYKCKQCDKAFKKRSNLSIHIRVHTGERPYKCTQCDKAFKQRNHLFSHIQVHTEKS